VEEEFFENPGGQIRTTTCNIGCGSDPWGDIRVDFTRRPRDFYLLGETSSANLIATVTHLPFVDKCLEETRCHQVLEHVQDWRQGLKEICRVSKKVDITVPCISHIAKNEPMFIVKGILDYVSQTKNSNVSQFQICSLGLKNLDYFRRLPERCREHLWQFDDKILKKELKKMNFKHISVETTYHNLLGGFKRKDSWRITAS